MDDKKKSKESVWSAHLDDDDALPSKLCLPSWLGLENTWTASLQRGKTPPPTPTSVLNMTLNLMGKLQ